MKVVYNQITETFLHWHRIDINIERAADRNTYQVLLVMGLQTKYENISECVGNDRNILGYVT